MREKDEFESSIMVVMKTGSFTEINRVSAGARDDDVTDYLGHICNVNHVTHLTSSQHVAFCAIIFKNFFFYRV